MSVKIMQYLKNWKKYWFFAYLVLFSFFALSINFSNADILGVDPIAGHCLDNEAGIVKIISRYNYKLVQVSRARYDRLVKFYVSETDGDNMILVADEKRSRWCIQFTSKDPLVLLKYLIGRYDPTTKNDEGVK